MVSMLVASADTIYLRNGEKIIGEVLTEKPNKVIFKSQTLGKLDIARERIERIERGPAAGAFVPPPPAAAVATNAPSTTTNAAPKRRWFWQNKSEAGTDWIQLKSGEWLRGRLYGMQNRELEFESDELEDLKFDWKDIHQLIVPQALVSYGERQSSWGSLRVDRENVQVDGAEAVRFDRDELVGIAPGSPRERDYWSGRVNVGLNLRAGNTEQADLVTKIKLERRTPITHLTLEYIGNYSETSGEKTIDNQRFTESFDMFLTRRLFLRVPQAEYYRDPFQNIGYRFTAGGGVGYYLIDTPKVEWLVAGGPAYQKIRFDTVQAGEKQERSTPAAVLQSDLEIELTRRTDLEVGYQATVANSDSGGLTQHGVVTFEIDLTRHFDLDVSFIWDRIGHPQADGEGNLPEKDDFRLNVSLGLKF
jgi:putative salt-induced outer membrane protein YdiY